MATIDRAQVEARMSRLKWEPDRTDLREWLENTVVLSESQRDAMLLRFLPGGTVRQLIQEFREVGLREEQLDDWYSVLDEAMDTFEGNQRRMTEQARFVAEPFEE